MIDAGGWAGTAPGQRYPFCEIHACMCRRTSLAVEPWEFQEYVQRLGIHHLSLGYRPRYNIAPKQDQFVILQEHGHHSVHAMRWGLMPPWRSEEAFTHTPINARAESVRLKPMFRHAFAHRRGLVVVDSFYAWQRHSRANMPFRVHRRDGQLMTLAALWERRGPEDDPLETCAIITTDANAIIRPIQDRMPVVLAGMSQETWLNPHTDPVDAERLLMPDPSDDLTAYAITRYVNAPTHDGPQCWTRATP